MERPNFTFSIKPSFNNLGEFPVFEGERSTPFAADLNNDTLPELLIGNLAGGLAYYKGTTTGININGISENGHATRFELNLYPNPNNGTFTIEPHVAFNGQVQMAVYNAMGQQVWNERTNDLIRQTINLSNLNDGMYLLTLTSSDKVASKRIVIQK